MISEYRKQYCQRASLRDALTNIPVNKKAALHNKFKGRGNYAILDDLVGGNGQILTRYNAFCKKNGMACFVKCCSNNKDCANVCCTSDGCRDDSRFSTYECVLDPSHDQLKSMPHPTATAAASGNETEKFCHDMVDGGGGGGARDAKIPMTAPVEENCNDEPACACACPRQQQRRYKCACNEPEPWCALCSETKKCQLDEVDSEWRGICQEIHVYDEQAGLSIKTKLKGMLSRMENLETTWLCGNCKHYLAMRIDVVRANCPCPFPKEPPQRPAPLRLPPTAVNCRCSITSQQLTSCGNDQSRCECNVGAFAGRTSAACGLNCVERGSNTSAFGRRSDEKLPSNGSGKGTKEPKEKDKRQETNGREETKPGSSNASKQKKSHAGSSQNLKRKETTTLVRVTSSVKNATAASSSSSGDATAAVAAATDAATANEATAAANVNANSVAIGKTSKTTSVFPRKRDGTTQMRSRVFLDCHDCQCCR